MSFPRSIGGRFFLPGKLTMNLPKSILPKRMRDLDLKSRTPMTLWTRFGYHAVTVSRFLNGTIGLSNISRWRLSLSIWWSVNRQNVTTRQFCPLRLRRSDAGWLLWTVLVNHLWEELKWPQGSLGAGSAGTLWYRKSGSILAVVRMAKSRTYCAGKIRQTQTHQLNVAMPHITWNVTAESLILMCVFQTQKSHLWKFQK